MQLAGFAVLVNARIKISRFLQKERDSLFARKRVMLDFFRFYTENLVQRHMKNYHTLKNDSKSGAKKLKKEDIEEIQTSSARIIAQKSLSKGFYDR